MHKNSSFVFFSIISVFLLFIGGCKKVGIAPEWEVTHNPNAASSHFLRGLYTTNDNHLVALTSNFGVASITKLDLNGLVLWDRPVELNIPQAEVVSSQFLYESRQDSNGAIYAMGIYGYKPLGSPEGTVKNGSFIVKIGDDGEFVWQRFFDNESDANNIGLVRDVLAVNDLLYISGAATLVLDSDGNTVNEFSHPENFSGSSIAVDSEGAIYLNGPQAMFKLNANGEQEWLQWHYNPDGPARYLVPSKTILTADGDLYMMNQLNSRSNRTKVVKLDLEDGSTQWERMLSGYLNGDGGTGIPDMKLSDDGFLYVLNSHQQGRLLYKLRTDNGFRVWSKGSADDIATQLILDGDGVYIYGTGIGAKYDTNGNLLFRTTAIPASEGLDGMTVNESGMFVASSRYQSSGTPLYVAKYDKNSIQTEF